MANTMIVWAKTMRTIHWPAKVIEEEIAGRATQQVYLLNGENWGKLDNDKMEVVCWNCPEKEFYIKAGKSVPSSEARSSFALACREAEKYFQDTKQPAIKGASKRKENGDMKKNDKCYCKKRKDPDRNQNQISSAPIEKSLSKHPDVPMNEDNGDDDDYEFDELPAAFSPIEKPPEKMEKGTVVWAKFKDEPFWPAIFHSVDSKKKVWVYFFDETWKCKEMKRIILPVKEVIPFCCGQEKLEIILKEGNSLVHEHYGSDTFLKSVKFAEEYLANKASGKVTDFFIYECEEGILLEDDIAQLEATTPTRKQKQMSKRVMKEKTETKFKDLVARSQGSTNAHQRHKSLLKAINKTQATLKKILSEEIDCERHRIFKVGTTSQKNMLKHKSGYGPIDDDDIAEKVLMKLLKWYSECEDSNNFNSVTYVTEVWLPEAIILALMDSRKIGRKQAEEVFEVNK